MATLFYFGSLCSTLHNACMRAVCGRLESRCRYSNPLACNNFPWPLIPLSPPFAKGEDDPSEGASENLVLKKGSMDLIAIAARVAFLFDRYPQLTSLLSASGAKPKRTRKESA